MNYLIGGPARNGKSWFSKRVAEHVGTTPISGDVERDRLKSTRAFEYLVAGEV